jgi:hypothetical protein
LRVYEAIGWISGNLASSPAIGSQEAAVNVNHRIVSNLLVRFPVTQFAADFVANPISLLVSEPYVAEEGYYKKDWGGLYHWYPAGKQVESPRVLLRMPEPSRPYYLILKENQKKTTSKIISIFGNGVLNEHEKLVLKNSLYWLSYGEIC